MAEPRRGNSSAKKTGSFQNNLPYAKDVLDRWLSRFPGVYLNVDRFRAWENWDRRVYLSLVRRDDFVIDAGANVGAHTIALSRIVGSRGRVVAFEAVPVTFERLLENIESRSAASNVTALNLAVGNPATPREEVSIEIPGDDFTQASLIAHSAGSWSDQSKITSFKCIISSIDEEVSRLALPHLDFIKIDVEGGELGALRGAARSLTKYRPLVYCEVFEKWTASFGYRPSELLSFMREAGYDEARVIREGRIHPLRAADQVPEKLFDVSTNVVFCVADHRERIAQFDRRYAESFASFGG